MSSTLVAAAFAKTGKAQLELRERRFGLSPRMRQLLILVDGRRSTEELARLFGMPDVGNALAALESDGYIARAGDTLAGSTTRPLADTMPATGTGGAGAQASEGWLAIRERVVRALLDTIGPDGEDIAQRLGRCEAIDELRELLPAALSIVEAYGGRDATQQFLDRAGRV